MARLLVSWLSCGGDKETHLNWLHPFFQQTSGGVQDAATGPEGVWTACRGEGREGRREGKDGRAGGRAGGVEQHKGGRKGW